MAEIGLAGETSTEKFLVQVASVAVVPARVPPVVQLAVSRLAMAPAWLVPVRLVERPAQLPVEQLLSSASAQTDPSIPRSVTAPAWLVQVLPVGRSARPRAAMSPALAVQGQVELVQELEVVHWVPVWLEPHLVVVAAAVKELPLARELERPPELLSLGSPAVDVPSKEVVQVASWVAVPAVPVASLPVAEEERESELPAVQRPPFLLRPSLLQPSSP